MAARAHNRGAEVAVAIGVCVAGGLLVYAMMLAEGAGVRDELMVAAPEAARPGETIALRTYLYGDPDSALGPTPEEGEVRVELRAGARVLERAELAAGALLSAEGAIPVPEDAEGTLSLVAEARRAGSLVATVTRPLAIADDAPPAAPLSRQASPLAHFDLGELVADAAPAPALEPGVAPPELAAVPAPLPVVTTLDAWVQGGICVPEVRCVLAVDAGEPGISPRLTECAGVDVLAEDAPDPASRYHLLPLVVHGPEGTCRLSAVSAVEGSVGTVLAHRTVRLPVALATPALGIEDPIGEAGPRVSVVAPPGRDAVIVDVFRAGRWMRSATLAASNDPATASSFVAIPGGPLAPGVYLLEARADALATDYVAPRMVVVGGDEALAAPGSPAPPGARGAELAFRLAMREQTGLALPGAVSGLAEDRARLEARKRTTRTLAFVGIAAGILVLVVTVLRRGLAADAQARALMAAAGVAGADDGAARRRGRLTVVLMVLALGLACATGAALVAAHQIGLEDSSLAP
ncbi:MAG: hypothetical protein U0234_25405 [Sandaracinus sp.]